MGKMRELAIGYGWEKIPNDVRSAMLEEDRRIEALEAELLETRADAEAARSRAERYRVALEEIAKAKPHHAGQTPNEYHFQEKARAALSDGGENG